MMLRVLGFAICLLMTSFAPPAHAAEGGEKPPGQHWSFSGVTGTFDRASLQRGYLVYSRVCAACHTMERMHYRNLADLGYSEAQIKAIAAEYSVTDGPDDEGEMYERPALPSDRFSSPFPNKAAAAYANNGAVPPDMSLLAKARAGGADYIYAVLTGYIDPPHDADLLPGQYWNKYIPGHVIAMAPPLSDDMVAYEDGKPQTVDQYARDVAHFMTWASDPNMESRKRIGIKAFLFLLVFTFVAYAVKKKIWADAH